jgi:ATP-dependent Lon protease
MEDSCDNSIFKTTFDDDDELLDIIQKLNNINVPTHTIDSIQRDINRVRRLSPTSADSAVIRIYLEWVANLPWSTSKNKSEMINISAARSQLDADHFGYYKSQIFVTPTILNM